MKRKNQCSEKGSVDNQRGSVSNQCSERGSVSNWNSDMITNENEESIVKEMKSKTVFKYNEGRLRMKSGYKIVTSILSSAILYLSLHPYNMMFLSN